MSFPTRLPLTLVVFLFVVVVDVKSSSPSIRRLSENLSRSATMMASAVENGSPDEIKDSIASILNSYREMESGVEAVYRAAGGGKDEKDAEDKAEKYYALVDALWRRGVGGKSAAEIDATDLAKGAVGLGDRLRRLSAKVDLKDIEDVDAVLAHAEAILLLAEDLELLTFGKEDPEANDANSASEEK